MISAVFLGVEGVASDDGVGGKEGSLVEECLAERQFAVILFAAVGVRGERCSGVVVTEGDDGSSLPLPPRSLPSRARLLGSKSLLAASPWLMAQAREWGSTWLTMSLRAS